MAMAATVNAPAKRADVAVQTLLDGIASLYREPDWLHGKRREAWDVFRATPSPIRVSHLWRYTDPQLFESANGNAVPAAPRSAEARVFPHIMLQALETESLGAAIYVRDGLVWKTAVEEELLKAGVIVSDLHEAAFTHPDLVQPYLGSLIGPAFGRYEAFANAAWSGGLLIHVPRNVQIAKPVHVLTAQPSPGSHRASRLLVIVEEGATLTLIDEYGDGIDTNGTASQTNSIVEIIIGPGARVIYAPIQNWNRGTTSYLTERAQLSADAYLETVLVAVGSGTAKVDCGAILAGPGAESNIYGLGIGDGRQHFDHHTVHHHAVGRTKSDLHFKVALRDQANSVYTGLIRIEDQAAYCEAYQENRNLILSPTAKAETIPELEILNNEVRCTHGATVGKIDPMEIFYLESRGIDREEAMHLIVGGFVEPILEHVPAVTRERFREIVIERLEKR